MGPEALQLLPEGALGLDFWSFPYVWPGDPVLRHSPRVSGQKGNPLWACQFPKELAPTLSLGPEVPFQQLRLWALLKYTFYCISAVLQKYDKIN